MRAITKHETKQKTTQEQQKQSMSKNSIFNFWKDRININKQLLWTQTAIYVPLLLISNLRLNVDESSH